MAMDQMDHQAMMHSLQQAKKSIEEAIAECQKCMNEDSKSPEMEMEMPASKSSIKSMDDLKAAAKKKSTY